MNLIYKRKLWNISKLSQKIFMGLLLVFTPLVVWSSIPKSSNLLESLPHSTESFASETRNIPQDKEELWGMIKSGEIKLSHAFYMEEGEPVCYINTYNNRELVPAFAHPADSPSSIAFREDFPECGTAIKHKLSALSQRLVPEGEKFASFGAGLILVGLSCGMGGMVATLMKEPRFNENQTIVKIGAVGGAMSLGAIITGIAGSKVGWLYAVPGALGGLLSAGVCFRMFGKAEGF